MCMTDFVIDVSERTGRSSKFKMYPPLILFVFSEYCERSTVTDTIPVKFV